MQAISSVWRPLAFLPVTLSDELHFCFNLGNFTSRTQVTQCKESTCSVGDKDLIPGSGRYPGEGNSNPLQYSCLGNPMDLRSLVSYSPWGRKEVDMTERLNKNKRCLCTLLSFLGQGPWTFTGSSKLSDNGSTHTETITYQERYRWEPALFLRQAKAHLFYQLRAG